MERATKMKNYLFTSLVKLKFSWKFKLPLVTVIRTLASIVVQTSTVMI